MAQAFGRIQFLCDSSPTLLKMLESGYVDLIFAMAPLTGPGAPQEACEQHAVRALGVAIERAVRLAHGRDGIPGLAD